MLAINQETQTAPFPAEITAETGTRGLWGGLLRGSAGGAEQGTPRAPTIEGSHPCPSRRSPKARQLPDQRLVLLTVTHPMLLAPKFHLPEREPKPALITGGFGAGLGLVEPSWGRGAAGTGSQADTAALLIPSVSKRASCGRGEEAGRGGVHLLSCVTACPNAALNICPKHICLSITCNQPAEQNVSQHIRKTSP